MLKTGEPLAQVYHNSVFSLVLAVSTYAADPWLAGTVTTFTVEHLPQPAQARVLREGQVYEGWRVSGETSIELKAEVQDHAYLVMRA